MKRFLVPLVALLVPLVAPTFVLAANPEQRQTDSVSPLIGKAAPPFTLTQLDDPKKSFSPQNMQGKVWVLNAWASWCAPCRIEHPVLVNFSRQAAAPIVGLNYIDVRENGNQWLSQSGNPYFLTAFDGDGKVGFKYGVVALPQTFIIDKQGVIRLKHVGPVTPEAIRNKFLPLIRKLNQ